MFLLQIPGFAEIKDLSFENQHTVRITTRSDDDDYDLYLTRVKAIIDYNLPGLDRTIKISPFFEYQSNFDTNTWWRKEVGAEIGSSFFDGIFYYGASFQHIWQKEENYPVELLDETTEWESRFVITPPLNWWIFKDRVTLRFFDEYTFDFKRGQATFNDVGVILDWKVTETLRIPIGWRHVDRIHDFDSDMLEFSVLSSF
ncbi:MAG: hypothetical protein NG712_05390 [Omnitrophica bacterium]|nr:hypothetical protein [Candidatus Omnitrophota bacterium]